MALNDQQKYLMERLPKMYSYRKEIKPEIEPAEIKKARKLVKDWDNKQIDKSNARDKRMEDALKSAREAIYFKPAGDALKVVKALEDKIKNGEI